ncbi:MAG: hypothetical protein QGG40_12995, partial [Myxococcota bacterium]|nr:hypothetical protein [Myxococcota bacterium]
MRGAVAAVLTLTWATPALGAFPDDVVLTQLDTWSGAAVSNANTMSQAYETVLRQLGAGVANKPMAPANTLGIHGLEVGFLSGFGFIDAGGDEDDPSPWARVHPDEDPTGVLWIPTLSVRKGLPFSLEAGANFGYVAFSRQTTFGAFGRWGLFEGFEGVPDLSIQLGYTGYVGNEELE